MDTFLATTDRLQTWFGQPSVTSAWTARHWPRKYLAWYVHTEGRLVVIESTQAIGNWAAEAAWAIEYTSGSHALGRELILNIIDPWRRREAALLCRQRR